MGDTFSPHEFSGGVGMMDGEMSTHPSFSTSARQVIGVVLSPATYDDVGAFILPWADQRQFVTERKVTAAGESYTLYRGVNRQKFIRHELRLAKLDAGLALVAESTAKGQPMDVQTAELMDVIAPLAGLKPKHIRNDIGTVEDGEKFISNIKAHLSDAVAGLPFILIAPPHEGPAKQIIDTIIGESSDIDVIRVGKRTKKRIRALGFETFILGYLLLRVPGHVSKVIPVGSDGEGLRDAIRVARASYGRSLAMLLNGQPKVASGDERKPGQHSSWTVQAALLKAWSKHHDILELHRNALDTAEVCDYHDPEWVFESLDALCRLAAKWKAGESIGGNWEQVMKTQGYDYTPRSSMTTLGRCSRHYEFSHGEKRIVAEAHLGRGSQGARNVIRIYLHRDDERKVLVVCHVGGHLPTGSQTT